MYGRTTWGHDISKKETGGEELQKWIRAGRKRNVFAERKVLQYIKCG